MTRTLQRLWLRLTRLGAPAPHDMSVDGDSLDRPAFAKENLPENTHYVVTGPPGFKFPFASQWFLHDLLFISMLLLALTGVIFRLSLMYWVVLTPIFALASIAWGWRHFLTRRERVGLAFRVGAIWCALLMCIYLLYVDGIEGVMSLNASSLTMTILLALGMFVAGVQARVWQISAVGAVLFLAAPGLGWLNQSSGLVTVVCALIALGGIVWWIRHHAWRAEAEAPLPSVAPLDDASHLR